MSIGIANTDPVFIGYWINAQICSITQHCCTLTAHLQDYKTTLLSTALALSIS